MKQWNKVRSMKGVAVGRGSAGRARATGAKARAERERQARAVVGRLTQGGEYFPDVLRACRRWLREHGVEGGRQQ
jgi:hypothetical protein